MGPNVAGMFICMVSPSVVTFATIGYPTWLLGVIKSSDWPNFLMIFFSDTTWRMELQTANQVLLIFGPIENPRWPPAGDIV
jgi:hypothetical protein